MTRSADRLDENARCPERYAAARFIGDQRAGVEFFSGHVEFALGVAALAIPAGSGITVC